VGPQPIVVPTWSGPPRGQRRVPRAHRRHSALHFRHHRDAPGRELEAHLHPDEDDAFYIVEGQMSFIFGDRRVTAPPTFVLVPPGVEYGFRNDEARPVRMLNIHAPAGFDRRIGLAD
jgi:mannose-6-phosphate isomerase-like protein (cupin superfamily)